MELLINGKVCVPKADQSLLELIQEIGLDSPLLSQRPLAAKIAGEVFSLNYIPIRRKDANQDRISIRRAMAASQGKIQLLYYDDPVGRDVYIRTAQFVLFMALHRLVPKARAKINCTVGNTLFIEVTGAENFSVESLKNEIQKLQHQNLSLIRRRVSTNEALSWFLNNGREDKAKLLSWRKEEYFDLYSIEDFADYYYGELLPSTGYLQVWDIQPTDGGFFFIYPDQNFPDQVASYIEMPKFLSVSTEGKRWCEVLECETVSDLNALVETGKIRELIRVNEALHEKQFAKAADQICQRGAKVVLLAGPSSSGKTTSANRLATQLRVHGKKPVLMSLDDYYIDRDKIVPDTDGKVDLEHINTIDCEQFRTDVARLIRGEEVKFPTFDFMTGRRVWSGHSLKLHNNSIIIAEGLHGLNPAMLPADVNQNLIFRLYVSPLVRLKLDNHKSISTSYLRLLRRIVRDYRTRGASVRHTLSMWDSVRRGEKRWIFPYQKHADVFFNSATHYELAVLKKHILPLLAAIEPDDPCYDDVRNIITILNCIYEADVDDEIPPTSLIREFIGGNSFYRK